MTKTEAEAYFVLKSGILNGCEPSEVIPEALLSNDTKMIEAIAQLKPIWFLAHLVPGITTLLKASARRTNWSGGTVETTYEMSVGMTYEMFRLLIELGLRETWNLIATSNGDAAWALETVASRLLSNAIDTRDKEKASFIMNIGRPGLMELCLFDYFSDYNLQTSRHRLKDIQPFLPFKDCPIVWDAIIRVFKDKKILLPKSLKKELGL